METKFCKKCGQANTPAAAICRKCGESLGKNSQATAQSASVESKSGGKLYWILGGIGALVLIGGFFAAVLIVGLFIYSSQNETLAETTEIESNSKVEPEQRRDAETEKRSSTKKISDQPASANLESLIKNDYQNIGDFKLLSVNDIEQKDKKIFRRSLDEAFAIYSSDEKNPLEILLSIANFKSIADAKIDVARVKLKSRAKKGKILKERKFSDGIIINYREKSLIKILDCKNKSCLLVTGTNAGKVGNFHEQVSAR